MIVGYLDILWTGWSPCETDSVLVVDPYGVLALAIFLQRMELVAWRAGKVFQTGRGVDSFELAPCDLENVARKALRALAIKDEFGRLVFEAHYHRATSDKSVSQRDTIRQGLIAPSHEEVSPNPASIDSHKERKLMTDKPTGIRVQRAASGDKRRMRQRSYETSMAEALCALRPCFT
jgi:hypothetical protein